MENCYRKTLEKILLKINTNWYWAISIAFTHNKFSIAIFRFFSSPPPTHTSHFLLAFYIPVSESKHLNFKWRDKLGVYVCLSIFKGIYPRPVDDDEGTIYWQNREKSINQTIVNNSSVHIAHCEWRTAVYKSNNKSLSAPTINIFLSISLAFTIDSTLELKYIMIIIIYMPFMFFQSFVRLCRTRN